MLYQTTKMNDAYKLAMVFQATDKRLIAQKFLMISEVIYCMILCSNVGVKLYPMHEYIEVRN